MPYFILWFFANLNDGRVVGHVMKFLEFFRESYMAVSLQAKIEEGSIKSKADRWKGKLANGGANTWNPLPPAFEAKK